jgi:hypothetical protein
MFPNIITVWFSSILNKVAKSVKSITLEEHLTLKGVVFKAEISFSLANATTKVLYFKTPNNKDVIWASDLIAVDKSNISYKLLENVAFNGTVAQAKINLNRQSTITSLSELWNTATGYSNVGATEIDLSVLLGGTGALGAQYGSLQPGGKFMILKRDTKYSIEILNSSGATSNIFVKSIFAEEDFTEQ